MIKKKKIIIFGIIIFLFVVLFLCTYTILVNNINNNQEYRKYTTIEKKMYSIPELYGVLKKIKEENKYEISINNNNYLTYNSNIEILINIDENSNLQDISIIVNNNKYSIDAYKKTLSIQLEEGKNSINIAIYNADNKVKEITQDIFYIEPYKAQFNDEKNINGVSAHFGLEIDNIELIEELKNLGIKTVRDDISLDKIYNKKTFNYSKYDEWINELNQNNIELIAIINNFSKFLKNGKTISCDEDIELISKCTLNFVKRYNNIKFIQILNEQNLNYLTDDEISWYCKCLETIQEQLKNEQIDTKITMGPTCPIVFDEDNKVSSTTFFNKVLENVKNTEYVTSNQYDETKSGKWLNQSINMHNNLINSRGGFIKFYISEYGISTYANNFSQSEKADRFLKQNCLLDKENINLKVIYKAKDNDNDLNNKEQNYGLIDYNYGPKLSYYSMKNYYQNTNGAEYIGQVNIANGIEAHVYDKDGKPKIIAWATDTNKPVTIDYLGFKASDLYGKEIENTNGKLEITTSPVYIDNVSTKNFYQAISNSITTGYKEFDEKFANEINKVPELKTKISTLNTFAESLKNVNTLDENIANSKMKEHFSLGNTIIKAYDDGRLDIEYVKLSSILDYLNTIGNAYEDLITVSAKTRITDLTSITNEVNEAKSIIENDTDIDIVYPNKIYKFSKDLLDTSSYVLGLDEENDIKTGLINSKATHAKYLADWSKKFSKIYIKGWLQGKVNIIKDENSKVYSKNEQLKSNTKISTKYNSLIENLNNLPSQTTSITKDTINLIYNQQYELINTIVDEFNNKKLNISESEYQTLVTELLNISEQYKELFNAYITEDDIENSTIENNINNVIDRYNENKDIDMTMCAELINNIKEIYNDKIQTEETSYNYLNKRRIQNTCTIISKMLENKIKETAQQEAQKIGIAYNIDPSTLTNKDVIAQIKLPNSKSSIESNPNNEKYTFIENGTKNITINIRGYKYNYNIKVTNIDKTPPQINGIEQSGKYKESVTPQITDENLSEVKLIKDGQEVENYKQNTAITQEGIYQLKATDKAGNETSINFVIAYPEDEKYKIENNTIKNIKGETSVETLKGKLQVDEKYTIKRKDTEIQNSENIATGDILETESGNKYTLIVRGDINKDGKVDIKDLVKMRKFLLLGNNLDESEEMAADTNIDGKEISIKDLVKMRIILLTQ